MANTLTKIDDKADGFTVEFTVTNTYRRTFDARPPDREAMGYAREQVATVVPGPVEDPKGVVVVPQPVDVVVPEPIIDITPQKPAEPPPVEPPAPVTAPVAPVTAPPAPVTAPVAPVTAPPAPVTAPVEPPVTPVENVPFF